MHSVPIRSHAWLLAASAFLGCEPSNVVLTTETCPVCSDQQLDEWARAGRSQGILAADPVGPYLATFPAERYFWQHDNWYPNDSYKQTVCGRLHHYNLHPGTLFTDENDWNNFLIPTADFVQFISSAPYYPGATSGDDSWHDCDGTNDCMEAEITPHDSYLHNPFFPDDPDDSWVEGDTVCVYGPWVREDLHDNRPEIHPSELVWWRMPWRGGEVILLMYLQDASDRFDDDGDFDDGGSTPPSNWRPWAETPRTGLARIAFALDPRTTTLSYSIHENARGHVVTADDPSARLDSDDGTEHALRYDGRTVLRASEHLTQDNDLGVRFVQVCRNAAGTRVQGYVALTSKIGESDEHDREGYHVLYIGYNRAEPALPITGVVDSLRALARAGRAPPRPFPVTARILAATLRRDSADGTHRLVVDVELRAIGSPLAAAELFTGSSRRALRLEAGAGGRTVVRAVPIVEAARIDLRTTSGVSVTLQAPALALTPVVSGQRPVNSRPAPGAWSSMLRAVDAPTRAPAAPAGLEVRWIDEWELEVTPVYAAERDGAVRAEDASAQSEPLNEAIGRGDTARMKQLFGTASPFRVTWSIVARDVLTGAAVDVREQAAAPRGPAQRVTIKVPEQAGDRILQITATASVVDAFGRTGRVRHTLWSHALTSPTPQILADSVLPALGTVLRLPRSELLPASALTVPLGDEAAAADAAQRRVRTARLLAIQSSRDAWVLMDELRALIGALKVVGRGR